MVTTLMSNTRKVGFFAPDPVSYAQAAVATIGIQRYTHGYWSHALQVYIIVIVSVRIELRTMHINNIIAEELFVCT